ncbi:hypothetical protein IT409_01115 [Candidatus Falkowbacteria bacterium]|nr:hypothetical protein [Candidatus Falkowbacteria bacterium]
MEQLELIQKPWYQRYKKVIGGVMIALLCALFAFFVFLNGSKQDILRFIPKSAHFVASLHIDGRAATYPYLEKLTLTPAFKLSLIQFLSATLDDTVHYNFSFAILGDDVSKHLMIFATNKKIDANDPFYAVLFEQGYTAFAVTHGISSQNYLVIAKDASVIDQIKAVTSHQIAGMDTNLSLSVPRQAIEFGKGFVYLTQEGAQLVMKDFTQSALDISQVTSQFPFTALLEARDNAVIIKTTQYHGTQTAQFTTNQDFVYRIVTHLTPTIALKYLTLGNKLHNQPKISPDLITEIDVVGDGKQKMHARLATSDTHAVAKALEVYFEEYLRNLYATTYQQQLPDKSTIPVFALNRDQVTVQDGIVSYVDQDIFSIKEGDGFVEVARNTEPQITAKEMEGCVINPQGDYFVSRTQGGVAQFFDTYLLSTYPQGYPQFLLCFK